MDRFDLVIIGGGVGGLVAASGAAQLGARVALVEKDSLGGDCLHYGCVPTKRLLHSAKIAHTLKNASEFGMEVAPAFGQLAGYPTTYPSGYPSDAALPHPGATTLRVDFKKVMDGVRRIQAEIGTNDDPERFRKMGVEVIFTNGGTGSFKDPHTFEVDGQTPHGLHGKRFLIATGSSPVMLSVPGLREASALTNITALALKELPRSITILGAGPIGIEFAQVFARLGSKVTIIEKLGQVLPKEDPELSARLEEILTQEGIEIHTCNEVTGVTTEGQFKVISARCETGDETIRTDEVMTAIGRSPNVEGLGLERAGVEYDTRKGIKTDRTLKTSAPHIYAVGDVTGPYAFTHVAEYQAGIAISNALLPLIRRKADYTVVPWVTYTDPELARVGLTEEEAKAKFGPEKVKVYRFDFKDVDRAVIEGQAQGLIKLVCDRKQRLLGAHILGPHAGELIGEYTLAMKAGLPITKISQTIHAYPTISQAVKRAADQYYKERLFSGWLPKLTRYLIRRGG